MASKSKNVVPLLLLSIGLNIMWGASPAIAKNAMREIGPLWMPVLRVGLAALALLPGCFDRRFFSRGWKRDFGLIVLIGLLTFGIGPFFGFRGLHIGLAARTGMMVGLEPVLTLSLGALFLGERVRPLEAAAFALAFAGVGLLSGFTLYGLVPLLLYLVNLSFDSFFTLMGAPLIKRRPSLSVASWACLIGFAFQMILLTAGRLSGASWYSPPPALAALSLTAKVSALYLGVFVAGFGYAAWYWLLKRLPFNTVVAGLFIQPVGNLALGCLWLGESLTPGLVAGAALIFASQGILYGEKYLPRKFFKPRIQP